MMILFTFDTFDFVLHYLLLCTLPAANGTYAYIEASLPRNVNDTARLISALLPPNSRPGVCLSFWYHMYGPDIDTLSVYAKVGSSLGSAIWKRTGNQANKWKYGQVFIRMALSYQVGLINTICQSTNNFQLKMFLLVHLDCLISNGNRTEWSTIQGVIGRVISNRPST